MNILLEHATIDELKHALSTREEKRQDEQIEAINKGKMSVLKLDKNFHVYCHSSPEKLIRECDEKGDYLKLYYKKLL